MPMFLAFVLSQTLMITKSILIESGTITPKFAKNGRKISKH